MPTSTQDVNESEEERILTICLGYEPESLFLYGTYSQSAWSVLEAIYDGPIDIVQYTPEPVILTKMPSLEYGDVEIFSTSVKQGDEIYDFWGNRVFLNQGTELRPSGCTTSDCAVIWDGISELQMDQIKVIFHLHNYILWSDGYPLTAADSVYSFKIAADKNIPCSKTYTEQTESYQAVDDFTIQWTSKPGFLTNQYENYFWIPLPEHAWKKYTPGELLTSEESSLRPIGWGAYVIQEWQSGKYIRLTKNPHYSLMHEDLPKFDTLVFRFINPQGDANIEAILDGSCDFTNQTTLMLDQSKRLSLPAYYYTVPKEKRIINQGPKIEYLFITSNREDTKSSEEKRITENLFLRQAIAHCIDRSSINKNLFNDFATIPLSFIPTIHPFYINDLEPYQFDIDKGQQILDEMGWVDDDHDPITPRVANQVTNITDGTRLSLRMITTMDEWEEKAAILIKESLAECGVGVNLELLQENEFFNPQGSFFQSNFDLALFGWMSGEIPPCYLFSRPAQEILYSDVPVIDINVSRYNNLEYDALCKASLQPLVSEEDQRNLQKEMQSILNRDLPFLPLFTYYQANVARNDFCPFELDISARSDLQDIESMDFGDHCLP